MPPSRYRALASNLAVRLEAIRWTRDDVERVLRGFLPDAFQRYVDAMAQGLITEFPQRYAPDADQLTKALLARREISRLIKHCTKTGVWPALPLEPARMQPVAPFDALAIPTLHTVADLAEWFLLTPEQLSAYADQTGWREAHPMPGVNNYFYRISPKSNGGYRLIEAPKPRLKTYQRMIQRRILNEVPVHPNCFGFVRGRNCIDAAQRHAGEEVVITFDLRNYFSNLRYGRVYALFRHLGYPVSVAHSITGMCTVTTPSRIRMRLPFEQRQTLMAPHLPQGAPSSPALANVLTYRLDRRLTGLARSLGANYTRYADDLFFSGDREIRRSVLAAVPEIVKDEGFHLNRAKTKVSTKHQRQSVMGIVVNETLNISRNEFDRLKALIHQKAWKDDPSELLRLTGQIGWVAQVNPKKAQKLYEKLDRAQRDVCVDEPT